MKKVLSILIVLSLAASLVACAPKTTPTSSDSSSKKKVLGIITPVADHGFTGESITSAQAEVKALAEANGFDYKFLTSGESSGQANYVDTLINEKVDAIVMWPTNGDELKSAAQSIMDAKIPLIIYDRLINNFTPTATIMGDNDGIGQMTGTYFNKYFAEELKAGEVQILEFKGDNSTVPQERHDGFMKTADKKFKIIQSFSTDWQRAKALSQMETILNTSKASDIEKIKGIVTQDDEVLLGVLDALSAYKGTAKLNIKLVSGVGGRKENLDTFKPIYDKLKIDQVTYAFSPAYIRQAIKLGADVLAGKTIEKSYIIKTEEIDKANMDAFRNSDTYKTRYGAQ
ncbi:MAG TPA: substrate-binding domain-containing protein [Clostridiaceae bacterium]